VEIEKADTTNHHHAMKEVQEIGVTKKVQLETHKITIEGADGKSYILQLTSPKDNKVTITDKLSTTLSAW